MANFDNLFELFSFLEFLWSVTSWDSHGLSAMQHNRHGLEMYQTL